MDFLIFLNKFINIIKYRLNKVNVECKNVLEYCNGFISLNSIRIKNLISLEAAYKYIYEYIFNTKYENKLIKKVESQALSTLSTIANT